MVAGNTLLKFFFRQMLDQLREHGAARVHSALFHPARQPEKSRFWPFSIEIVLASTMRYHADLQWVRMAFRDFSRTVVIRLDMLTLIIPRVVLDEFKRNKERVAQESRKSMSAHFRLVKDALTKVGGEKKRLEVVLSHLDDVNYKIPLIGGATADTLDRIE